MNEIDPMTLGAKLRGARLSAGMTQADLETMCGIPKARLSRYENNHVAPSISSLMRLCSALGVRAGEMLDPPQRTLGLRPERATSAGATRGLEL